MEVIVKYLAGATIWVRAYIYDSAGSLVDPTTVKLTLADSAGATKVNNLAMTKYAVGTYDYYYNTTATSAEGWWNGEVWVIDGSGDTAKTSVESFGVEVRAGL